MSVVNDELASPYNLKRRREWIAWQGDLNQLQTLGRIVGELGESRRKALFPERIEEAAGEKEKKTKELNEKVGEAVQALDRAISNTTNMGRSLFEKVEYKLEIRESDLELSGNYDTTLTQIDRRTARGAIISYQIGIGRDELIKVDLGGSKWLPSCELEVASADAAFGRAAFSRLSDEIAKGIPWWAKWGVLGKILIVGTIVAAVSGTILSLIAADSSLGIGFNWKYMPLGIVIALVISPLVVGAGTWPLSRLFPVFELSGDGVSSATRRLVALVGLLLTIPIGIFVNKIS